MSGILLLSLVWVVFGQRCTDHLGAKCWDDTELCNCQARYGIIIIGDNKYEVYWAGIELINNIALNVDLYLVLFNNDLTILNTNQTFPSTSLAVITDNTNNIKTSVITLRDNFKNNNEVTGSHFRTFCGQLTSRCDSITGALVCPSCNQTAVVSAQKTIGMLGLMCLSINDSIRYQPSWMIIGLLFVMAVL